MIQESSDSTRKLSTGITLASAVVLAASSAIAAPSGRQEVLDAARTLGINAQSLACLDVSGSEPTTVLDRLEDEFASFEQYESLQNQILEQQQIVYRSQAILRDLAENNEAQAALDQAQVRVVELSNIARGVRSTLIMTLLDELADTTMIDEVLNTEGPIASLPPAYRLATDTAQGAKGLAWALRMQERADAQSTSLSGRAQQIISQAESQQDVLLGKVRVSSYQTANQTAIEQWVVGY